MMRTAISPRLAMSSLSNAAVMVRASRRFDDGQRLARIDGFAVLHGKAPQPSCHVGRDFAELLHHLDQADHIAHGHGDEAVQRSHGRSEEHTSELQSQSNLVCRLLLEKKKKKKNTTKQRYRAA